VLYRAKRTFAPFWFRTKDLLKELVDPSRGGYKTIKEDEIVLILNLERISVYEHETYTFQILSSKNGSGWVSLGARYFKSVLKQVSKQ